MANVYTVKYVAVSEIDGVRVSKSGQVAVLAEEPQEAGGIAQAHLATDGVIEVSVHLVQELAKNVIVAASKVETPVVNVDIASAPDVGLPGAQGISAAPAPIAEEVSAPVPNVDDVVKPLVESAEQKPGTDAA